MWREFSPQEKFPALESYNKHFTTALLKWKDTEVCMHLSHYSLPHPWQTLHLTKGKGERSQSYQSLSPKTEAQCFHEQENEYMCLLMKQIIVLCFFFKKETWHSWFHWKNLSEGVPLFCKSVNHLTVKPSMRQSQDSADCQKCAGSENKAPFMTGDLSLKGELLNKRTLPTQKLLRCKKASWIYPCMTHVCVEIPPRTTLIYAKNTTNTC